jgi:lipopolysaccharide biosynthesis glycosyltransferase
MDTAHRTILRPLVEEEFSSLIATPGQILVLCAVDDNYAMPLAVMLQSAGKNVAIDKHVHVLLMDGGISDVSLRKLEDSLSHLPMTIHLVEPDHSIISDLPISHHATYSVYFRLLAGLLLPKSIERIIYLDADMIVYGDISELWEHPIDDHYCLAVQDISCPFIASHHALANNDKARKYLAEGTPIQNWRQLGLDPKAPYFNSGVMVLNLVRWRQEQVENALLECLRSNERHIWCWDQYALNVVFSGNWGMLPARWNQGAQMYKIPGPEYSPIPLEEFLEMRDNPAVVHFTTEWKPWKYNDFHPLRNVFLEAMDRTEFGGWRPEKPLQEALPQSHYVGTRLSRLRRSPKKFILRNILRVLHMHSKPALKTPQIPLATPSLAKSVDELGDQPVMPRSAEKSRPLPDQQKLMLFIHLPKCAGTTLVKSFARLGRNKHLTVSKSGASKAQALSDLEDLIADRQADANKLEAVSGHDVFIGMHEVSDRTPLYATVLREPLSRYISHYRFYADCALDESHIIHDYTRELMIEDGELISLRIFTERRIAQNTMATYLAAASHPDRSLRRASLSDPVEIYELAAGALQRMDFIGLVEEFPGDLQRLCRLVGLRPAPTANRSSYPVSPDDIDDELRQMILDNNQVDVKIYELGKQLREEKFALLALDTSDADYAIRLLEHGGIEASDVRRLNALEQEVEQLKALYLKLNQENSVLQKKLEHNNRY